jgi:3'(2'), 5'-bisphosphate nucleotidase
VFEIEYQIASELARSAGAAILKIFHDGFEIEQKPVSKYYSEPVTIADITSSRIIVEGLAAAFPADAILSEEEVDDTERRLSSDRVWIVDPLDGTKGFTQKQADFAVQIALVERGVPVVGVVYQPLGDVFYGGAKGEGAFLANGAESRKRLRVSGISEFSEMTMAVSRSHRSEKMDRVFEHFGFEKELRHGSVGLKVGFLAQKTADIYIHMSPHTKFWDTAAPQIILEEAGGTLTDIFGGKIDYTLRDVRNHNGIFASNAAAHFEAVDHLRPLLNEFGRLRITAARLVKTKRPRLK